MEIWGLILSIVGLVLALIALPWLAKPIEKSASRIRVRGNVLIARFRGLPSPLSGTEAIRKGTSTLYLEDFMICDWTHKVIVDYEGTATVSIDLTLVNLTKKRPVEIVFPVYLDYEEFYRFNRPGTLPFWAKVGRATYEIFPKNWDAGSSLGNVTIPFPMPLGPGKDIRIRWGYAAPRLYSHEGHHWFEWYFARPQSVFRLSLNFLDPWRVKNVEVRALGVDREPTTPRVTGSMISWLIKAPTPGSKCRVDFHLAKN